MHGGACVGWPLQVIDANRPLQALGRAHIPLASLGRALRNIPEPSSDVDGVSAATVHLTAQVGFRPAGSWFGGERKKAPQLQAPVPVSWAP